MVQMVVMMDDMGVMMIERESHGIIGLIGVQGEEGEEGPLRWLWCMWVYLVISSYRIILSRPCIV